MAFSLFLTRHVFHFHCVGLESYWTVIFKWLSPIFLVYMNVWLKRGSVVSISYDVINKNTEIENWFSCQWVNLAAWICPVDESHQISIWWFYVYSSSHWKWCITCLISGERSRSSRVWALLGWATSENPQVRENHLRCFSKWCRQFTPLNTVLLGAVSPDWCDLRGGHRA